MKRRRIPQEAFAVYVAMGPTRSFRPIAEKYGFTPQGVAKRAKKERWVERAEQIDWEIREAVDRELGETLAAMDDRHLNILAFGSFSGPELPEKYPYIIKQHDKDGKEDQDENRTDGNTVGKADGHGNQELSLNAFFKDDGKESHRCCNGCQDNWAQPYFSSFYDGFLNFFTLYQQSIVLGQKYNRIIDDHSGQSYHPPEAHQGKRFPVNSVPPEYPQH